MRSVGKLFPRLALAAIALLAMAFDASAGVSKLKREHGGKASDLRAYQRVVVEDFTDGVSKTMDKPDENAAYHAEIVAAGQRFADQLAEKLAATKAFASVSRTPVRGRALIIKGKMTEFRTSNIAGRYIGFGVGSKLGIEITATDADGNIAGRLKVSEASTPIPGVGNVIQTVDRFIDGTTTRVTDEFLIAKGNKFREETGRSGRQREKYKASEW